MFGLFKKKSVTSLPINPIDKKWVEELIIIYTPLLGSHFDYLKILIPGNCEFEYDAPVSTDDLDDIVFRLCKIYSLNKDIVEIKIFDNISQIKWDTFNKNNTLNQFPIVISLSNLQNPIFLIAILAHQLALLKCKVQFKEPLTEDRIDDEPKGDIIAIMFGFGIFILELYNFKDDMWIARHNYIYPSTIIYCIAITCKLNNTDPNEILNNISYDDQKIFSQCCKYLDETSDLFLIKEKIESLKSSDPILGDSKIDDLKNQIFIYGKYLKDYPDDPLYNNNIGYCKIYLKEYEEAILHLTKSISMDPFFAYVFNNRGFCRIKIRDFEGALSDIETSLDLDRNNPYAWRNLGAYHLEIKNYTYALELFQKSYDMDFNTESIQYYLGIANYFIGDKAMAESWFKRSIIANEFMEDLPEDINL